MSALPAERNEAKEISLAEGDASVHSWNPYLSPEVRKRLRIDILLSGGFVYSVNQDALRSPEGLTVPGAWLLLDDEAFYKNYEDMLKSFIKTELTFPKITLGEEPEC
jgi:hypothetical protein